MASQLIVDEPKELVFVYGTLRSKLHNSTHLHDAELVALDEVPGRLWIIHHQGVYSIPGAQFLHPLAPTTLPTVKGELYRVSPHRLKMLDAIESHPDVYRRTLVVTVGGHYAWAYEWPHDVKARNLVEGGDWAQWVQAKMASKARR